MMRNSRRVLRATTAVLLFAVAVGCAQTPSTDPTSGTGESTPQSPTTSKTKSESEAAIEAATENLHNYYGALDSLRQDDDGSPKSLEKVAVSTQLTADTLYLESEREKGHRQTGDTQLAVVKAQSVSLDNSDPSAGKVPTVTVDVCWDVTDVDVLDKSGKSIVAASRPDTGWTRFLVANYHWSDDPTGGWRVASGHDLKQTPCKGS